MNISELDGNFKYIDAVAGKTYMLVEKDEYDLLKNQVTELEKRCNGFKEFNDKFAGLQNNNWQGVQQALNDIFTRLTKLEESKPKSLIIPP